MKYQLGFDIKVCHMLDNKLSYKILVALTFILNMNFVDFSLGSTRFFKVARAKTKEGLVVVKVFVIHDPSLPLKSHRTFLEGKAMRGSNGERTLS